MIISIQSCTNADGEEYMTAPQNKYIICRGSALYLNDGKKWKTNYETTDGINAMIKQVQKFSLPADTTSYHLLANSLMKDYIYIINYCEYMGNNHEMVHSYLYPIQELIIPLQIGGEITCKSQFPKLKDYLAKYHEYFE